MQFCNWFQLRYKVRAFSLVKKCVFIAAMKLENYVDDMIGCLQVVRIYSFMEEIKLFMWASYIVFSLISVKSEKISYKRNKTCFPCLHSLIKTSASRVSTDLLSDSPKRLPLFSLSYIKARRKCFIS